MKSGIQGKIAVVTGGASGIGKETAREFARNGAKVVVSTGSNIQGGEETVRLIKEAGGEAIFIKCDVSLEQDVEAMVKKTIEHFGSLDFAFNNAGVGPDGKRLPVVSIVDTPMDVWNRTIDTNLTGCFLCMKYELKHMLSQGSGVIVNTSSIGGLKPIPNFGAYAASKSGIITITKTAALESARSNIRVNVVCPGPTDGTLLMENIREAEPENQVGMESVVPLGRLGSTYELAKTVMWLCSDEAAFITGQAICVDGGITAG